MPAPFPVLDPESCLPNPASSYDALDHHVLDVADRLGGIELFRADIHAVHDGVAAEQTVRVFQVVEALAGGMVARVGGGAVGLQQPCRADELVRVPPERRAGGGAATAQNAFVQARPVRGV